jgi:hypothetical protein
MEIEWATVEAIANTRALDLWYFFSLEGFASDISSDHHAPRTGQRLVTTPAPRRKPW